MEKIMDFICCLYFEYRLYIMNMDIIYTIIME